MRAAFYGDADDWKLTVYGQARDNALKAVARLARARRLNRTDQGAGR